MKAPAPLETPPASGTDGGGTPRGFLRTQGKLRRLVRRIRGRATQQQLMPVLIKVYAGFSKLDGAANEDEIESSLGFMRYDYPETVYSELQALYRRALREPQDLDAIAAQLRGMLNHDEKIQLAVQLYVLITRSTAPACAAAGPRPEWAILAVQRWRCCGAKRHATTTPPGDPCDRRRARAARARPARARTSRRRRA